MRNQSLATLLRDFGSDYSQTASNASHNSCRFVRDRAHAANNYDPRDAFEQRYAIMKSPNEKIICAAISK